MDIDETVYEKNCFRNMLMERSQQPTQCPQYPIKSDEIPHQYEDSCSADLKMEQEMYYNDTYQGGYYAPYVQEMYQAYPPQQAMYYQAPPQYAQYPPQDYMYAAPPAEYNYGYPAEEACDYDYPDMEEAEVAPEVPVAASQDSEGQEKEEFLRALRKIERDDEVVIKSTDKVGKGFSKPANGFRGSKYRGVSRNGNQWQVSASQVTEKGFDNG